MTKSDKLKRIDMLQAELSFWKEMILGEQEEHIQYPIICRNINTMTVVKFTGLNEGECLYNSHMGLVAVGETSYSFIRHTDTKEWKKIAYDEDRDLFDKQVVWCWDNGHIGNIRFYDAVNKSTFYRDHGERNGVRWKNYEAVKPSQIPDFMLEAYSKLED